MADKTDTTPETNTITVKLTTPISVGGKVYEALTFSECKAKHLMAMDLVKGVKKKTAAALAGMAGVGLPVFEEMSVSDFNRVREAAAPLMGNLEAAAMEDAITEGAVSTAMMMQTALPSRS